MLRDRIVGTLDAVTLMKRQAIREVKIKQLSL